MLGGFAAPLELRLEQASTFGALGTGAAMWMGEVCAQYYDDDDDDDYYEYY